MMTETAVGALAMLETMHAQNPALFDRLIAILAERPEHGEVTLRFRDRRLFMVETHAQHRE